MPKKKESFRRPVGREKKGTCEPFWKGLGDKKKRENDRGGEFHYTKKPAAKSTWNVLEESSAVSPREGPD